MNQTNEKSTRKTNPRRVPTSTGTGYEYARETLWLTDRERAVIPGGCPNNHSKDKEEDILQGACDISSFAEVMPGTTPPPAPRAEAPRSIRTFVDEGDSKPSALKHSERDVSAESSPLDLEQGNSSGGVTVPRYDRENSGVASFLDPMVATIPVSSSTIDSEQVSPGAVAVVGSGRPSDGNEQARRDDSYSNSGEENTMPSQPPLVEAELIVSDDRSALQRQVRQLQEVVQQMQNVQPAVQAQVVAAEESGQAEAASTENEESQIQSMSSALEQDDSYNKCRPLESIRKRCYLVMFGLPLVVVAAVLGVVLSRSNSGSRPVSPHLKDLIVSVSLDNGTSLNDDSSPQSQALSWLDNNMHLSNYSDLQKIQRYVLATLHYSTNGLEWGNSSGWLSDENECKWHNSCSWLNACDDGQNISSICLYRNALKGTIPQELALLSDILDTLWLYDNQVTGSLPNVIGLLSTLNWFSVHDNRITGTIPTEVGLLRNMTRFDIHDNVFGGTIPRIFDRMTNLKWLHLYNNDFTGEFECPSFITVCLI